MKKKKNCGSIFDNLFFANPILVCSFFIQTQIVCLCCRVTVIHKCTHTHCSTNCTQELRVGEYLKKCVLITQYLDTKFPFMHCLNLTLYDFMYNWKKETFIKKNFSVKTIVYIPQKDKYFSIE